MHSTGLPKRKIPAASHSRDANPAQYISNFRTLPLLRDTQAGIKLPTIGAPLPAFILTFQKQTHSRRPHVLFHHRPLAPHHRLQRRIEHMPCPSIFRSFRHNGRTLFSSRTPGLS